jgi:hypothetical protein
MDQHFLMQLAALTHRMRIGGETHRRGWPATLHSTWAPFQNINYAQEEYAHNR